MNEQNSTTTPDNLRSLLFQSLLVAIFAQCISFFLYSYPFWMPANTRWLYSYQPLCDNPWTKDAIREPQVRHRILAPIIAHYVGLRGMEGVAIPVVANTFTLFLWHLLLRRYLDKSSAAWATVLLGTTLVIISSQTWLGFPDSLGNLAITLCLYFRQWWVIFPVLLLGMLAEERCAAAFPLVLLWHLLRDPPGTFWKNSFLRGLAGLVTVAAWLGLYQLMLKSYVVATGDVPTPSFLKGGPATFGLTSLKDNLNAIPAAIYQAIRTGWIFPVWLLLAWWRTKPSMLLLYLICIGLSIAPALLVGDISRSAALVFPAMLIALVELQRTNPEHLKLLLRLAVFLNILSPQYQVVGQMFQLYWPLPFSLFRAWKGI